MNQKMKGIPGVRFARKVRSLLAVGTTIVPHVLHWLAYGREVHNFTYTTTEASDLGVEANLALLFGCETSLAATYRRELLADQEFRRQLRAAIMARGPTGEVDWDAGYGRAMIHYVAVRLNKPRLTFEAGTADGFGSVLIGRALSRNRDEGFDGKLVTVDVRPDSGWLVGALQMECVEVLREDSLKVLARHAAVVDYFVFDTVNDKGVEREHYAMLLAQQPGPALLAANWHFSGVLAAASARAGRRYVAIPVEPLAHWRGGNTIGLSANRMGLVPTTGLHSDS